MLQNKGDILERGFKGRSKEIAIGGNPHIVENIWRVNFEKMSKNLVLKGQKNRGTFGAPKISYIPKLLLFIALLSYNFRLIKLRNKKKQESCIFPDKNIGLKKIRVITS